MNWDFEAGEVILIDKPLEWTSFDIVKKIRNCIKVKKVGHAGTLDPLATGLLVICTGKKTKTIDALQGQNKEYIGTFRIGATTPSYDLETPEENFQDYNHISRNQILDVAQSMIGAQEQIPPMYSAIQVDGVRLYKLARKGEELQIKARNIEIFDFEITDTQSPVISFRLTCSKGTYVRSIARDFGIKLGVGAYLSSLRRTKVGTMDIADAWLLDDFIAQAKNLRKELN
ncbi:MAG: tRNA pseudouridine(55) synthase TruB [Cytophagales bacterium]|nr:MAG: tRNA pseudouridine(55) synthase TruB [Cytophagales bacterium]